jgi:hypothetical protein
VREFSGAKVRVLQAISSRLHRNCDVAFEDLARRAIPVADRHGMRLGFESGHDDALGTLGVLPVRSAS